MYKSIKKFYGFNLEKFLWLRFGNIYDFDEVLDSIYVDMLIKNVWVMYDVKIPLIFLKDWITIKTN